MVETYWAHGVQAFVTPVGENEVGVAVLTSDSHLRYQDALQLFPELTARLQSAVATSNVRGAVTASRGGFVGESGAYIKLERPLSPIHS